MLVSTIQLSPISSVRSNLFGSSHSQIGKIKYLFIFEQHYIPKITLDGVKVLVKHEIDDETVDQLDHSHENLVIKLRCLG